MTPTSTNQPTHTHTQTQVLMSPDAGKERVGKNGADYHLRVLIVRRSAHIIQNIILFVMMIQTLSFTAFWLDPIQELSDRLQVVRRNVFSSSSSQTHSHYNTTKQVLTLLLTVVAFKLMIKEQLPSVPYMTDLDKYAFCSSITKYVSFQNTHTHTGTSLQ